MFGGSAALTTLRPYILAMFGGSALPTLRPWCLAMFTGGGSIAARFWGRREREVLRCAMIFFRFKYCLESGLKQGQRGSIRAPARPVDLVQILLYLTKLDLKPSQGVNHLSSFTYNLRESVLGRALRSENKKIGVPRLHHGIHREPITVASNGTAFGSCNQQLFYSDEVEIRVKSG